MSDVFCQMRRFLFLSLFWFRCSSSAAEGAEKKDCSPAMMDDDDGPATMTTTITSQAAEDDDDDVEEAARLLKTTTTMTATTMMMTTMTMMTASAVEEGVDSDARLGPKSRPPHRRAFVPSSWRAGRRTACSACLPRSELAYQGEGVYDSWGTFACFETHVGLDIGAQGPWTAETEGSVVGGVLPFSPPCNRDQRKSRTSTLPSSRMHPGRTAFFMGPWAIVSTSADRRGPLDAAWRACFT